MTIHLPYVGASAAPSTALQGAAPDALRDAATPAPGQSQLATNGTIPATIAKPLS